MAIVLFTVLWWALGRLTATGFGAGAPVHLAPLVGLAFGGKGSEAHKASVTGGTVGDLPTRTPSVRPSIP